MFVCFHFSRKDHTSKERQMTSDPLLKPLLVSGVRFILGSTSRGGIRVLLTWINGHWMHLIGFNKDVTPQLRFSFFEM